MKIHNKSINDITEYDFNYDVRFCMACGKMTLFQFKNNKWKCTEHIKNPKNRRSDK